MSCIISNKLLQQQFKIHSYNFPIIKNIRAITQETTCMHMHTHNIYRHERINVHAWGEEWLRRIRQAAKPWPSAGLSREPATLMIGRRAQAGWKLPRGKSPLYRGNQAPQAFSCRAYNISRADCIRFEGARAEVCVRGVLFSFFHVRFRGEAWIELFYVSGRSIMENTQREMRVLRVYRRAVQKKSQFLNSDEEKPVSPEKSHSMGTFLAFFGLYWLFFVWLF